MSETIQDKKKRGRPKIKKEATIIKRGRGRPPSAQKKTSTVVIPKTGISTTPKDVSNKMEFIYDNPMPFNRIFKQHFKGIRKTVQFKFTPNSFIIYTQDHTQQNDILIGIDLTKVNHYYCKDTISVGLSSKNLEIIMNMIDKTYDCIKFVYKVVDGIDSFYTLFENINMGSIEKHKLTFDQEYQKITEKCQEEFDNTKYPIKFKLLSKFFKKKISDFKSLSDKVSIIKRGEHGPITFFCFSRDRKNKSQVILNNDKKIELESKITEDDIFSVEFDIDNIMLAGSSTLAEFIHICASENDRLLTKMNVDNGVFQIKILTQINTFQRHTN